jgi:hypothetical protein
VGGGGQIFFEIFVIKFLAISDNSGDFHFFQTKFHNCGHFSYFSFKKIPPSFLLNDFECGICENKFESVESIGNHLQTFEKFKSRLCELTGRTLSDLKKHTKDRHKDSYKGGWIYHIKLDRSNFKDVTFTGHWSDDI